MDRVVYSTTATDLLVWRTNEADIIVWDLEPPPIPVTPAYSRVESTVFIPARLECCGPL